MDCTRQHHVTVGSVIRLHHSPADKLIKIAICYCIGIFPFCFPDKIFSSPLFYQIGLPDYAPLWIHCKILQTGLQTTGKTSVAKADYISELVF
ncbi:Os11g0226550 [Oryza sativa Japonica Group]|uniref:Os11g0226550 protein n=1 Tax=Oryza sativa subsp. japonica TaxID=39947 RepID=A0A0P0Y0P2_ORYSJ|nr:Os11g0226550 [Oryza sativa Japonica Group]